MIAKLMTYGAIVVVVLGAIGGYLTKVKYDAVQEERAKVIAQSNQNIATRRATDATFDKMDAAALCRDAGLEWMSIDGKSFCR